jgi:hypothetical protein
MAREIRFRRLIHIRLRAGSKRPGFQKLSRFFLALLIVLIVTPAWALQVDQRCLNLCISGGATSVACLNQCSYGTDTTAPPQAPGTNHNVLEAPQPVDSLILNKPKPVSKTGDEDYTCFNQCLKNSVQYDACHASCIKKSCPTGSSDCRDLLGRVPASASLKTTSTP